MVYSQALLDAQAEQAARVIEMGGTEAADRPDYEAPLQSDQWKLAEVVRDVYAGTAHMRKRERRYLPQLMRESNSAYTVRVNKARLYNATRRTAKGLTGMVLRKDPGLEDVPPRIVEDAYNIDLAGRALPVFARDVFLSGVLDGISYVYVDFPQAPPRKSIREDRLLGLRPFWTDVRLRDLVNVQWELKGGAPFLTLVVMRESTAEPTGTYGQEAVVRYREVRPGEFTLWEKRKVGDKAVFTVVDEGPIALGYIPLFPFYAERTGFFQAEAPLLDLAYENIGHYELSSEREKSRTIAHVPFLYLAGFPEDEAIEVSEKTAFRNSDPNAKVEWVVYEGQALSESRQDLRDAEARMASLGMGLISGRPSPQPGDGGSDVTATSDVIRKSESDAALVTMSRSLKDCMENALQAHAEFRGEKSGGALSMDTEFYEQMMTPQEIMAYSSLVGEGKLDLDTFWDVMEEGHALPETFDREVVRERLGAPVL